MISAVMSGCAGGWSCAGWKRQKASVHDTAKTKSQILAHNDFGRKQGCW